MLAQARGVGADTIRRHLKALQDYGLARATREGWVRHNNRPEYLDSLAETIGVLGRGIAQKQVHAAKRAAFTIRQQPRRRRNRRPSARDC